MSRARFSLNNEPRRSSAKFSLNNKPRTNTVSLDSTKKTLMNTPRLDSTKKTLMNTPRLDLRKKPITKLPLVDMRNKAHHSETKLPITRKSTRPNSAPKSTSKGSNSSKFINLLSLNQKSTEHGDWDGLNALEEEFATDDLFKMRNRRLTLPSDKTFAAYVGRAVPAKKPKPKKLSIQVQPGNTIFAQSTQEAIPYPSFKPKQKKVNTILASDSQQVSFANDHLISRPSFSDIEITFKKPVEQKRLSFTKKEPKIYPIAFFEEGGEKEFFKRRKSRSTPTVKCKICKKSRVMYMYGMCRACWFTTDSSNQFCCIDCGFKKKQYALNRCVDCYERLQIKELNSNEF